MKAQNRRAFQNVMRSPSPDIAHRSIITNTKPPVNQIKDFMRMRQTSKSPNASLHQNNKPSSDTQEVNKLRKQVQQLQARIKFLQRIKISHQQLTITNQRLNNELEGLKLQLRDNQQRSQSSSSRNISPNTVRNKSPRLKGVSLVKNQLTDKNNNQPSSLQNLHAANIPAPTDNILREFNERIVKMSEENIRLGKKLKEIYDQKDILERQNNMLKAQKNGSIPSQLGSLNDVQSLKRYFGEESERITRYYQGLNECRMSQLGVRISTLQNELIPKLQQVSTKRLSTSTPKQHRDTGSNNTYSRTQSNQPISSLQPNRYMSQSKYTTSPSEFKTSPNIETSPGVLQQEKQKIKKEKDDLYRRTMDVEGELKMVLLQNTRLQKRLRQVQSSQYMQPTTVYKPSPLQQSNMSTYRVSQQRIQSLEHQLTTKTTELRFKTMQLQQLQMRLREMSGFRQSQTQNHMKVIAQQREKTLHYLQQLEKCQQRISQLQRNTVNKQQFLLQQIQLNRLKSLYQQSQNQYSQLKTNFSKYLEMVMQIRQSLTGEQMEECLKDIQNKWKGYDQLQMEIIKVHQCHQLLIQEYKQNILEKQQKIAHLEKQNLLLKEENQQNLVLIQKLEKAIYDFNQPAKHQLTEEQIKKRFNHHQTADKNGQRPCLIRDYITKTDRKLESLQNQVHLNQSKINIALQFQQQSKKQNPYLPSTNRNKYTLNPVEVQSIYRKSTQTLQHEDLRQFSDGEQQYQEEHEEIPDEYELMGKD